MSPRRPGRRVRRITCHITCGRLRSSHTKTKVSAGETSSGRTCPEASPGLRPAARTPEAELPQAPPKLFWLLMILGLLLLIGIISSIANPPKDEAGSVSVQPSSASSSSSTSKADGKPSTSSKKSAPATSSSSTSPAPAKKGPGIEDEARDGQFAFTVTKVKRGVKSVGDQYLNAQAQGQFCLVTMTVKNIGDSPQTMFSSNQKGFIGDTEYGVDDTATLYTAKNGDSPWIKDINPGNALTGTIVFDIPKGKQLDKLELHDSAFSGGVEVFL